MALVKFELYANEGWKRTGINLAKGDSVTVTAEGSWLANPATGEVDADGVKMDPSKEGPPNPVNGRRNYPLQNGIEGQLVAAILPPGNNYGPLKTFPCGKSKLIEDLLIQSGGELVFTINDDMSGADGPGLFDNMKSLSITINLGPVVRTP
jgi:hypothetical protein